MSIPRAFIKASVALALTSVAFFTTSAFGQSPAARPNSTVAVSEPKPGSAENNVAAEEPKPKDLQSEIEAVKTENAAVRELLRKMEEQQKILLEQVDRLQRRLDGGTAADVSTASQPTVPPTTADASAPAANAALNTPQPVTDSASTAVQSASVAAPQDNDDRYQRWNGHLANSRRRQGAFPAEVQHQYPASISQYTFVRRNFHRPPGRCPRGSSTQRHHGQSRDVHPGRLRLRPEAAI